MPQERTSFLVGPVATLATVVAILVTDRYIAPVPNPGAITFIAVVFATYMGGFVSGSISAAISLAYAAYFFSNPGTVLEFTSANLARLAVLTIGTPAIVAMVGILQERAQSALRRTRAARLEAETANRQFGSVHAALEQIDDGIVLLDSELRAQFINRAFRNMWQLPDDKADEKPAFVGLMYHGRKMRAYAVPEGDLDAYVSQRTASVRMGDETPRDLRLADGAVIRFKCKVLPDGGRMLSYVYVTDIVRRNDELETFRAAFDEVDYGVVLLDGDLRTQFMNRAVRELGQLKALRPGEKPFFSEVIGEVGDNGAYAVPDDVLDAYAGERIDWVRRGDSTPVDLTLKDGRIIRVKCIRLRDEARMLTYLDVTDVVTRARELEGLAATDALTGLCNRRQFAAVANAEWERFQRYGRPLSVLMMDIDHFKSINDRFGHDAGDKVLMEIAAVCREARRTSDLVARMGGEEFAILLPETDSASAAVVAEKLRARIAAHKLTVGGTEIQVSVSIGVADANRKLANLNELVKRADAALYTAKADGRHRVAIDGEIAPAGEEPAMASRVA
jgi:diguanylate cyclase (GGDEF)-like protein